MDANLKYIYFLNLAYPLDCLHVPRGIRVPPVENHCTSEYTLHTHTSEYTLHTHTSEYTLHTHTLVNTLYIHTLVNTLYIHTLTSLFTNTHTHTHTHGAWRTWRNYLFS